MSASPKRFECNSCADEFAPHEPHPAYSLRWVGHCESCCKHSTDLYLCEAFPRGESFICSSCCEAANERALSDYYGGSGPQTIDEVCAAAWAEKRAGKR